MDSIDYRLGEYKIRESLGGDLTWESHFGFGEYKEGRCFRKGRILFLGRAEGEGIGFLKGEFLNSLRKLPQWTKTEYYCLVENMVSCATGQKATERAIRRWCDLSGEGEVAGSRTGAAAGESYRLGRYQVTLEKTGSIRYQASAGREGRLSGHGFLVEGVLFLAPREPIQAGGARGGFLSRLKTLPGWDKTAFFSLASSLKECAPSTGPPQKIGRGRMNSTGKGSPVLSPREPGPGSRTPDRSVPSPSDFAAGLVARLAGIVLIMVRNLMVLISAAAAATWPFLAKAGSGAWQKIRARLGKS